MATIEDFGGYRVTIYPREHGEPHVHVVGPDFAAKVSIADAAIIAGNLPAKVRRKVLRWVAANGDMLAERWNEIVNR